MEHPLNRFQFSSISISHLALFHIFASFSPMHCSISIIKNKYVSDYPTLVRFKGTKKNNTIESKKSKSKIEGTISFDDIPFHISPSETTILQSLERINSSASRRRNVADETREMFTQAYLIARTAIDMLPFLAYVMHIALAFTDHPFETCVLHARARTQPHLEREVRDPLERDANDETEWEQGEGHRLDEQRR